MEGGFFLFSLLPFDLIIWYLQCGELLGDDMRLLLLWWVFFFPLATVALEIYHHCSGFGLFFFPLAYGTSKLGINVIR